MEAVERLLGGIAPGTVVTLGIVAMTLLLARAAPVSLEGRQALRWAKAFRIWLWVLAAWCFLGLLAGIAVTVIQAIQFRVTNIWEVFWPVFVEQLFWLGFVIALVVVAFKARSAARS